jgi:HK97 family phage portal protein
MARLRRAAAQWVAKALTLSGVNDSRGWMTLYRGSDTYTGSWQQDRTVSDDALIGFAPVYACVTLIASDLGKICLDLMELDRGIWVKKESAQFSPMLRKPNHYQTRQQFIELWALSKLLRGNTYALKIRDNAQRVKQLYVLDPNRVTPLVAPDGSVFYELRRDDLSKLPTDYPAIPASEIIHDRMECLFHPLVGIAPLWAAYLSTTQGLRIQNNSEAFFKNQSRPGGMLTAPHSINDETAKRLKDEFEANFSGDRMGRLFVGGDGLTYNPMAHTALDSQLVEQLKLSAEQVCSVFHVPAYMIGAGAVPSYTNVVALNQQYYQQCLQKFFNAIEDLIDDGIGLAALNYRTEFDLKDLMRMDPAAQVELLTKASGGAYMKPNEARADSGLLPVTGGDSLYKQHQDYSLEALAKRDAKDDPFAPATPPKPAAAAPDDDEPIDADEQVKFWQSIADMPAHAETLTKALPLLPAEGRA